MTSWGTLPTYAQAIIQNGTIQMGINREGHLNVPGGTPSSGTRTTAVGLRYIPTNAESTAPGCLCEGWGAADEISRVTGYANVAIDRGAVNLTVESFTVNPARTEATSVVRVGSTFRVTHFYHPSPTANLYQVDVTIENISGADVIPLYRRVMDWDIEPTAFSEFVTLIRGNAKNLIRTDNNGFNSANPFSFSSFGQLNVDFVDNGPRDHGALFDFRFERLSPGAKRRFVIYYGATPTEAAANSAISVVGVETYSFGQANVAGGPTLGIPNTFIFAFKDVGGDPVIRAVSTTTTVASSLNPSNVRDAVTFTATVTAEDGSTLPGNVQFKVDGAPLGSPVALSGGLASITTSSLAAGNRVITAEYSGGSVTQPNGDVTNYSVSISPGLPQVVNKLKATVMLNNLSQTYDGSPRVVTATTNPAGLRVVVTYDASTTAPVNAGSYLVKAEIDDPEFEGSVTDTLTVAKATPTISWDNPADIVYGTRLGSGQLNARALFKSADLPGSFTYTPGAGTALNAGPGQTLSVSYVPSDTTNFNPVSTESKINVLKALLTVTANNRSKTYGGANPPFTVSYSGFVLDQGPDALGGYLSFSTEAGEGSNAGSYAITPSGLTSSNYEINFVAGTLTINKAPLTVLANNRTKTYGAANPPFTASYTGFVLGQNEGVLGGFLSFLTDASESSNVGAFVVSPGGLTSGNYEINFVGGTLTINKAPLTVTANNRSRLYGGANPAFTASYAGFVLGQNEGVLGGYLSLTTTANESSDTGTHPITASGLTSLNYEIAYVGGTLTIDKAPLTIRASDKSRLYGAANPAFTVSYTGFVLGQNEGVLGGMLNFATATDSSDVGAYPITASGLTSLNYEITYVDGALTINKAPLTVTADNRSRLYGAANAFTASYKGFVLGQNESVLGGILDFTTEAIESSNVGVYAVTPKGLTSLNYEIAFVGGTLTINKAPLSVTADSKSKTYGDVNPSFTASFSGFVLGQSPTVLGGVLSFTTAATPLSGVGTYPITASGLTSGNYEISFAPGTLTVNKATPNLSGLSSPTIIFRTAETILSGKINLVAFAGTLIPTGSVSITLNGVTQAAAIQKDGSFSSTFATGELRVVNPAYIISYVYAGDGNFNAASGVGALVVRDVVPPVITINCGEGAFWPPNHDLLNNGFDASAVDDHDGKTPVNIQVFSDEDDEEDTGDGNHSPDAKDIASGTLLLRSERKGNSDGRVYLIIITATDAAGNTSTAACTVVVPHSQSKAAVASVNAQAAAAVAHYNMTRTLPTGYVPVGDGAIIGPKQ